MPTVQGKEYTPLAKYFGFLSGQGWSQDIEGCVCAVCGVVGISTASPGQPDFGDLRGRTRRHLCARWWHRNSVGCTETELRVEIPGRRGKIRLDLCLLLLSKGHGSAQTARWEVKRSSGEGLRGQTAAVSGTRRVSEELSVCLCCSAAKHSSAAGTSAAAVLLPPCPRPSPQMAISCSWRCSGLGDEGFGGLGQRVAVLLGAGTKAGEQLGWRGCDRVWLLA